MTRSEREFRQTLRRRRLFGLCLLAPIIISSLAINNWQLTPVWALFDNDYGTFAAGDKYGEWIYAHCDGDTQQVAVLQNGRLAGAEALGALRQARFPNWCDLPVVDHPSLGDWQRSLEHLQTVTRTPGATGAQVLDAARGFPVSVFYLKPLADWIAADDANAVQFLDAVAARPMRFDHEDGAIVRARRQDFAELIEAALERAAGSDVSAAQLTRWLESRQISGWGASVETLARMHGLDDMAAVSMLSRLEKVPPPRRHEVYRALAPQLVSRDEHAALLAEGLTSIGGHDRASAARELLARPDASPQFAIALLSELREFHGPDAQLELFTRVADKLKHDAEAPLLLTTHLKHLRNDMQRRMAATYLFGLDEPGETAFALGVLRAFSDLHPMSRPKVVYALMQSEQFGDRAVQEACLLAVQLQLRGPEQQELLSAMLRHHGLDSDLHSRISAELG